MLALCSSQSCKFKFTNSLQDDAVVLYVCGFIYLFFDQLNFVSHSLQDREKGRIDAVT